MKAPATKQFDLESAKRRAAINVAARGAAMATGQPLWFWLNIVRWRATRRPALPIDLGTLVPSNAANVG